MFLAEELLLLEELEELSRPYSCSNPLINSMLYHSMEFSEPVEKPPGLYQLFLAK